MSIEEQVVKALSEKGYTISCAESCTGGMLTSQLVNVPSASQILNCSFVTYSNEAKIKYLGVLESTIQQYGVVSEQVVGEMAKGVAFQSDADVGIGISGIAGPTGGTDHKPVGMVCFGFYINHQVYTYTQHFKNLERNAVREKSVHYALEKVLELLTIKNRT